MPRRCLRAAKGHGDTLPLCDWLDRQKLAIFIMFSRDEQIRKY
jgi:hypothetical protein